MTFKICRSSLSSGNSGQGKQRFGISREIQTNREQVCRKFLSEVENKFLEYGLYQKGLLESTNSVLSRRLILRLTAHALFRRRKN